MDATRVILTDSAFGAAYPLMEPTRAQAAAVLAPLIESGGVPVVTGFIGANADGIVTTLGRGGSDYSAAILGRALDAREVVIWTDVDGVMTADPRVVPDARTLPRLSYEEAAELSYFGAKVLHPKTIAPAVEGGIPVRIKNTFAPTAPGTLITADSPASAAPIRAITAIAHLALLTLQGKGMVGLPGGAARLFSTIARDEINVLMISQSILGVQHLRADRGGARRAGPGEHCARVRRRARPGRHRGSDRPDRRVDRGRDRRGHARQAGMTGQVFQALGEEGIDVLAIAQGSSELNLSFVVAGAQQDAAVRAIHRQFGLGRD